MLTRNRITKRTSSHHSARAQGMVEFAMALPILLMLIFGIIEFGRLLFVYSSVISAAREGARYGAAGGRIDPDDLLAVNYFRDCNGIREAATRVAGIAGVPSTPAGVTIRYDNGPGSPYIDDDPAIGPEHDPDYCPVNGTGPDLSQGDRIEVTVNAQFYPAEGITKLPALNIRSTVRRSVIINVLIRPDTRIPPHS